MFFPRSIHLLGLLALLVAQNHATENVEGGLGGGDSDVSGDVLLKKQGLGPDAPDDQLAIESGVHEQIEALPGYGKFPPVPVPVPIQGYPGSLVLPLPPQGEGAPAGLHPGPPPKKEYNNQGQFNHHQQHQFRQPFPGGPPQHKQQQQQEVLIAGHSGEQRFNGYQQRPPQQHQGPFPFRGDQGPPKPPHHHHEPSVQSILKEFLKNQGGGGGPKPGHRFPPGPPPPQHYGGPPQKQHHGPPPPPQHAQFPPPGKPFQASKEVNNELQQEGSEFPVGQYGAPNSQFGGPPNPQYGAPPAQAAGPWSEGPDTSDMAKIVTLEVKCEKNVMRVFIAFDRPFYGVIFSKGHYHNVHCIHLPAGLGHQSANFDVGIDSCGTQGSSESSAPTQYGPPASSGSGTFFENTIVIQYDSQVQEVWDQARKLRCTWHDQYEKSVTFRPFPVDMLEVVRADFAGDNVGCWMQIQVGKGPWASEVSGLVKIGQTMTMVLAIKDDENKFDMLVRNCLAHDGHRSPIQLVDQYGCIARPKLMSKFTKIKNFGASASVLSYAHFQAFKFPDSMEVHFQCTIQICRHNCPEQCSQTGSDAAGGGYGGVGKSGLPAPGEVEDAGPPQANAPAARRRRSATHNTTQSGDMIDLGDDDVYEYTTTFTITPQGGSSDNKENVGLNRVITVVSNDDLESLKQAAFGGKSTTSSDDDSVQIVESNRSEIVCMSTMGFASMLVVLIGLLLASCIVSAVYIIKNPRKY